MMRGQLARALLLVAIATGVLWWLYHANLLDPVSFRRALEHPEALVASVCCFLAVAALGIARHKWALTVIGIDASWRRVSGANLIGTGLGLWLPGSMALSEGIRIALLLGEEKGSRDRVEFASHVAMASLIDRLVGLAVMFLVGAGAAVFLAMQLPLQRSTLLWFAGLNLAVGSFLAALLWVGSMSFACRLLPRLTTPRYPPSGAMIAATLRFVALVLSAAQRWRGQRHSWGVSVVLAAITVPLNALTAYFAAVAVGGHVGVAVLLVALPVTVIGIILPTGVAGFGGPQVATLGAFVPLGVKPDLIVTMSVLQNSLALIVQTSLMLAYMMINIHYVASLNRTIHNGPI